MRQATFVAGLIGSFASSSHADDLLHSYDGDVFPYDESAGWGRADPCEDPCIESVENGRFVLRWPESGDLVNYHRWIAFSAAEAPPSLWVEWRFRSNHPLDPFIGTCDAWCTLQYAAVYELLFMYGDAAISFEGSDFMTGLDMGSFHTYRFESIDGIDYWISANGEVFILDTGRGIPGAAFLQFGGRGQCAGKNIPEVVNEWDFVRYGTISYGEKIVNADPPAGFLDPGQHPTLDRFTVTYDSPNYVYIDEITVEVTGGDTPVILQTRRLDNGPPDVVEIVLDRPIPLGERSRFIFNDGEAVNIISYTYRRGDSDADADIDLLDLARFQNCFSGSEVETTAPGCEAFNFDPDLGISLFDFADLVPLLTGPEN